jgi:hypothetical protein
MTLIELPLEPTMADIIERSCKLHPSLLAETLRAQAKEDRAFGSTRDAETQRSCAVHANHCEDAARTVEAYNAERDNWRLVPLGVQIVAANVAAKLQCLPRHILTQAAIRSDNARG